MTSTINVGAHGAEECHRVSLPAHNLTSHIPKNTTVRDQCLYAHDSPLTHQPRLINLQGMVAKWHCRHLMARLLSPIMFSKCFSSHSDSGAQHWTYPWQPTAREVSTLHLEHLNSPLLCMTSKSWSSLGPSSCPQLIVPSRFTGKHKSFLCPHFQICTHFPIFFPIWLPMPMLVRF